MKRALTLLWLAAGLLAIRSQAGLFSVSYSPTGIAYDAVNNLVSVSGLNQVNAYDTNGSLKAFSSPNTGISDLGAGSGGNVWVANGTSADKRYYNGNGITSIFIPYNTVALGRELSVGGTNYLMYAVNGVSVVAINLTDYTTTALMPTPANITGGDWILRPGGYALEHVLIAVNSPNTVQTFTATATNSFQSHQNISMNSRYGFGADCSFGNGVVWVAQDNDGSGYAVPYPFPIPPVPEAIVSVTVSNTTLVVAWTGRALQTSTNLVTWSPLTNAPQPCLLVATNAPQFFRAVK